MIPIYEVSNAELSALRCERIAQEVGAESYTKLWLTPDGKRIVKLFSEEDTTREFFDEDIKNDTSTLIALSSVSHCFDDRFVLPKMIYQRQSRIIGYSMPFICGRTLSQAKPLSMVDFKRVVRQVYDDIIFVNNKFGFSIADLHEDNIILGNDGKIYHIDLDGWRCGDGKGRRSRYIAFESERLASCSPKYKFDGNGKIIPDVNSDLLCLVHIIFNHLLQTSFYFAEMMPEDQLRYLNYITECCNVAALAAVYKNLFSSEDNYFDIQIIQFLPDDISTFSYDTFIQRTSRFKTQDDAMAFLQLNETHLQQIIPGRGLLTNKWKM